MNIFNYSTSRAYQLFVNGGYEDCIDIILDDDSNNMLYYPLTFLAEAYFYSGQFSKAYSAYEDFAMKFWRDNNDDFYRLAYRRMLEYQNNGLKELLNIDEAPTVFLVQSIEMANGKYPENSFIDNLMDMEEIDFEKILDDKYDKCKATPEDTEDRSKAIFELGEILYIREEYKSALDCFYTAANKNPQKALYWGRASNCSFVMHNQGQNDFHAFHSAVFANNAINLDYRNPRWHFNLALALRQLCNNYPKLSIQVGVEIERALLLLRGDQVDLRAEIETFKNNFINHILTSSDLAINTIFVKANVYSNRYNKFMLVYEKEVSVDQMSCGIELPINDVIAAGAGYTLGLKSNGNVIITGNSDLSSECVNNIRLFWKNIIAISAGPYYCIGLRSDGIIEYEKVVDANLYDQFDMSNWDNVVAIDVGESHFLGLQEFGKVLATGDNEYGENNVSQWSNIIAISAGSLHSVGLQADGKVVSVGNNKFGQCNTYCWENIIAISAGESHTVGLMKNNKVIAVGLNISNQCDVEGWENIIAITAGRGCTIGLKKDGTVISAGNNDFGGCNIRCWKDIIAISAGETHTVAMTKNGNIVATGEDNFGQCNVTDWNDIQWPKSKFIYD